MQSRLSSALFLLCLLVLNFLTVSSGALAEGPSTPAASNAQSATPIAVEEKGRLNQADAQMNTISMEKEDLPLVEAFLRRGELAAGERHLSSHLRTFAEDDQARFGLGVLQFLQAVERVVQELHRYGLKDRSRIGVFRLPVPGNLDPETLTYGKCRQIARNLLADLRKAEKTLAQVKDPAVKLPLHFGMIRLDLDGDGKLHEEESLWRLFGAMSSSGYVEKEKAEAFTICFDKGDVHWLRGYCNLIMAFCQIYLAYDSKELFDCTAHLIFPKVESSYEFLSKGRHVRQFGGADVDVVDLIGVIHLLRFELQEAERMPEALKNFKTMVAESKLMWQCIMAEEDDDHEWIPNPRQKGVIPGVKVTDDMVASWTSLMEQVGRILDGKLLIAFWRGDDPSRGVNLSKAFLQPRRLDLVLWVQGTAAAPYLEQGETTKIETWRSLQAAFGRQFPGFAIWFN